MEPIKLYNSPLKGAKILLFTVPFVLLGINLILNQPTGSGKYIAGWVVAGFFALGVVVGLIHMLDRRPQIIIDEEGIWDRSTHLPPIPWEYIQKAYPVKLSSQRLISLVLDEHYLPEQQTQKWEQQLHKAIGAQNINLTLSQLKADQHAMVAFIEEIAHETSIPNRRDIIKKYFAEEG